MVPGGQWYLRTSVAQWCPMLPLVPGTWGLAGMPGVRWFPVPSMDAHWCPDPSDDVQCCVMPSAQSSAGLGGAHCFLSSTGGEQCPGHLLPTVHRCLVGIPRGAEWCPLPGVPAACQGPLPVGASWCPLSSRSCLVPVGV